MADSPAPPLDGTAASPSSLPIRLIVSCTAAWVIAQLSYNALPQLLGLIKEAFDRSDEVVTRLYGYERGSATTTEPQWAREPCSW